MGTRGLRTCGLAQTAAIAAAVLLSMVLRFHLVAVAYADYRSAAAPSLVEVVDFVRTNGWRVP